MTSFEKNKGENRLKRGEILLEPFFPHTFSRFLSSMQRCRISSERRTRNPKNWLPIAEEPRTIG